MLKLGHLNLNSVLHQLRVLGIRSLMVEGGAGVINSFLSARSEDTQKPLVDTVIVTVAPVFIGNGVGYGVREVANSPYSPTFLI